MMLRGHRSIPEQGRQCPVSRDTLGSFTPQGSCIPGSGWDEACRWPKQSWEWRAERSRSGREQIWMWKAKKTQVKRKETKLRMGRPEFRTFLHLLCDLGQINCPLWEIAGRHLLSPPRRNAGIIFKSDCVILLFKTPQHYWWSPTSWAWHPDIYPTMSTWVPPSAPLASPCPSGETKIRPCDFQPWVASLGGFITGLGSYLSHLPAVWLWALLNLFVLQCLKHNYYLSFSYCYYVHIK